jgi:hypothetical protein
MGGLSFSTSSVFTYSGGAAGLAEVAALSSTPRCTPFAGVIAILLRLQNLKHWNLSGAGPALTLRWTEKLGVKS